MQIQVKDIEDSKKEKVFHPFVLELKIESEQDLIDLYCKFTLSPKSINLHIDSGHSTNTYQKQWEYLSDLLENKPYMK